MQIAAVGMVSPLGFNSSGSCAALRAGISRLDELPYWDCNNTPITGARVPGLDALQFEPRLVALLTAALEECVSQQPDEVWSEVPLFVALAEPIRPGGGARFASSILEAVESRLGLQFHELSRTLTGGHAAGFQGLVLARQLLQQQRVRRCIVAGVDSFINASSLFWLDQNLRLKRDGHMDGTVPGEAAAAVMVEARSEDQPAVQIVGLGFGKEKSTVLSGKPLLGHGLAEAARSALRESGWGFHDLDFRVSDVTGETYSMREHALAEARLVTKVRIEPQPLWHPVDCMGDTGAAAGLIQLAWVHAAMHRAYAPGPRALCFTSSVGDERAVAAVHGGSVLEGVMR